MKHLKKFSTLLLLLATITMVASSCKKDDESNAESDLIGTWVLYSSQDGDEIYYCDEDFSITMTLKSNGKGESIVSDAENYIETTTFHWSADSKYIYIEAYDEDDDNFGESGKFEYKLTNKGKTLFLYTGVIQEYHKK